jgi:hypothetical protein
MKISLSVAAPALVATILFTGCIKGDVLPEDSISATISKDATTPDLSKCKIRRIYQGTTDTGQPITAIFSYNRAGNPYSVLYSPGGTAVNDHYFIYDAKNRLQEWRLAWGGYVIQHHYYTHNLNDQIVKDSAIYLDCCGRLNNEFVSTIEYDAAGRVVKETIVNTKTDEEGTLSRTRRPTYTYDNRGNLGVLGWKSSSYDYKVNPLRQSPVFQFIHRNYSMNNPSVQPRYNSLGLPLTLLHSNDDFFNDVGATRVIYECQ